MTSPCQCLDSWLPYLDRPRIGEEPESLLGPIGRGPVVEFPFHPVAAQRLTHLTAETLFAHHGKLLPNVVIPVVHAAQIDIQLAAILKRKRLAACQAHFDRDVQNRLVCAELAARDVFNCDDVDLRLPHWLAPWPNNPAHYVAAG